MLSSDLLWGVRMVRTGVTRSFGAELRRLLALSAKSRLTAFASGLAVTGALQPGQLVLDRQIVADLIDIGVDPVGKGLEDHLALRSEEHTSELQSLMRNSYAVFSL